MTKRRVIGGGGTQRGFSLIESLVAMLVLAAGLVSTAIMTSRSVLYADNAAVHSQAVELAYDLADRLRANPDARAAYAIGFDEVVVAAGDCAAVACAPADFAASDLADWKRRLAATLPDGDGEVALAAGVVSVRVRWWLHDAALAYELAVRE